ncbi:MAG: three-Cys-motif partner protein TcmP [Nitrospirota bacterium]|nr:three-Cys-motif partner protein TcmP [Nitrospirota bacterium]MDH5585766.1 three-Cys-motif partner protein TcmP [Nitrospirota bacterium]MDH5774156.1 three-Cys-motif partner protein TcmP [Nitrospirota bacterium]
MPIKDLHKKPFDEGTLTKLQIFELYAREWLPVFLSKSSPSLSKIHLYDFFVGPGIDSKNILGSPLRILQHLRNFQRLDGFEKAKIHIHFFDNAPKKIEQLKLNVKTHGFHVSNIEYDIQPLGFEEAFQMAKKELADPHAAKLVFIDQNGVGNVTPEVFRELVNSPICDFLFFISSSTLYRFHEVSSIKQKIKRPNDYYHVHRSVLDFYRSLVPAGKQYFLAPFSIKKGANIYGLIFGSAHLLGIDKFLQVAWKNDQISGQADFDIDHDNLIPGQPTLPFREMLPRKVGIFEAELEGILRRGQITNELQIIELCVQHGVKRQHAENVLKDLKKAGIIDLNFRVPDIKRIKSPRPIIMKWE